MDDCGLECVNVKIRHCSLFFLTTSLWFGCVCAGFSNAALFLSLLQVKTIEEFFFKIKYVFIYLAVSVLVAAYRFFDSARTLKCLGSVVTPQHVGS